MPPSPKNAAAPGRAAEGDEQMIGCGSRIKTKRTTGVNEPFCPVGCSRPEACTWKCPVALPTAIDRLVSELARCAGALETLADAVVYEQSGDSLIGQIRTEVLR